MPRFDLAADQPANGLLVERKIAAKGVTSAVPHPVNIGVLLLFYGLASTASFYGPKG